MNLKSLSEKYIDYPSVAVASTSLAATLLNTIFGFYYLKVFLNVYKLDDAWLNVSQTLFLVWNAINDPIFGYMQDIGCCGMKWLMNRRKVILFGGPLYALVFMLPWLPWANVDGQPGWLVGLHLVTSLFLYDALLSLVLSAHCGLFTELTTKHSGRVRVIIYMEVAGLIGSFVILPVDALSKSVTDLKTFRICNSVVAMVSMLFFLYTGLFARDEVAQTSRSAGNSGDLLSEKAEPLLPSAKDLGETVAADAERFCPTQNPFVRALQVGWLSSKGIFSNRDFWCVVCANFFHILRLTANGNFLAIYVETLVSLNGLLPVGSFGLSIYYTFCSFLPKLVVILCWPVLNRFGAFATLACANGLTVINAVVAFCLGRQNYISVLIFLLLENIFCSSLWPAVYNIFFPDVVDEDMKINKRSHPFSTTIFTLNALITKPAISLAPIIVVAVLNNFNYNIFQDYLKTMKANRLDSNSIIGEQESDRLMAAIFGTVCFLPVVCAVLEMLCFLPYTMKFKHRENRTKTEQVLTVADNVELVECSENEF